jgi:hypothetical protein
MATTPVGILFGNKVCGQASYFSPDAPPFARKNGEFPLLQILAGDPFTHRAGFIGFQTLESPFYD